ncbi:MAG: outer membrane lipid asymmetry maintenance protein MlaD [Marinicaulis sp.]|nr:outer membrane lipid asymmetry maintenance protein MlaD [Marinicaulis sp.]NNE41768.1 outer membrane lipid asymmetry maintenance protein MlaD [Marinicaulis sp.]NNL89410.1 outer membrane lipid asymmetry maintenance protein MlaD [Marinicaulis sp.]
MNRSGIFETIVGLIVVAVAAAFMFYAYGVSDAAVGKGQIRLGANFGKVDGISVGSEVRIAGVKIGSVAGEGLNTQTYEADLNLLIDADIPIPDDSVAKISADGLLGGAYVAIEPGASEEYLADGDRITITQGSVDFVGLAVQAFTAPRGGGNDEKKELDPLGDF